MNFAVTGATGLFGHALVEIIGKRHTVFSVGRAETDITRFEEVQALFRKLRPDVVVHAAANPSPGACGMAPARAFVGHVDGTRPVAEGAREGGGGGGYISADAGFDGASRTPYLET